MYRTRRRAVHILQISIQTPTQFQLQEHMSQGLLPKLRNLPLYSSPASVACHSSCSECFAGGVQGCLGCSSSAALWENQCVEKCPAGSYAEDASCWECGDSCASCEGKEACLTCAKGLYKVGGECIKESECPPHSYPDENTMACASCDESCLECYGPTSKECLVCNHTKGYTMAEGSSNECYLKQCMDGMYLSINGTQVNCLPCDSSCKTCADGENCTECLESFLYFPSDNNTARCEGCPLGYAPSGSETCKGKIVGNC